MSETKPLSDEEQVALILGSGVADEYRLTSLGFEPDVIYDIGADVGSITLWAHKTYPNATIVAVEPNSWSYPRLVENVKDIPEIDYLRAAIGQGQMFEVASSVSPLHWLVVGRDAPTWTDSLKPTDVPAIMLDELYARYGGEQYVVKMDCESAEIVTLTHEPSCQMIIQSAFFAAELHIWSSQPNGVPKVADIIFRFLFRLAQTHTIHIKWYGVCVHVWAKKRIDGSVEGGDGVDE